MMEYSLHLSDDRSMFEVEANKYGAFAIHIKYFTKKQPNSLTHQYIDDETYTNQTSTAIKLLLGRSVNTCVSYPNRMKQTFWLVVNM